MTHRRNCRSTLLLSFLRPLLPRNSRFLQNSPSTPRFLHVFLRNVIFHPSSHSSVWTVGSGGMNSVNLLYKKLVDPARKFSHQKKRSPPPPPKNDLPPTCSSSVVSSRRLRPLPRLRKRHPPPPSAPLPPIEKIFLVSPRMHTRPSFQLP